MIALRLCIDCTEISLKIKRRVRDVLQRCEPAFFCVGGGVAVHGFCSRMYREEALRQDAKTPRRGDAKKGRE